MTGQLRYRYNSHRCGKAKVVLVNPTDEKPDLLCNHVKNSAENTAMPCLNADPKNCNNTYLGTCVAVHLHSNARDMGSIPDWGTMIPYTLEQLSPCTATREKPTFWNEDPAQPKGKN